MENQVKRKRGGQIKYHTEEERKAAIRSQTKWVIVKKSSPKNLSADGRR